jgi:putative membrane protein
MLGIGALGNPFIAAAQGRGAWEMPMMQGGWGIVMMILMLLFWAAIVVVIIVGIRWLLTSSRSERHMTSERETQSALDILKARYARGEISKKEFEAIRRDIE